MNETFGYTTRPCRNGTSLGPPYLPRRWCPLVRQPQTEAEIKNRGS